MSAAVPSVRIHDNEKAVTCSPVGTAYSLDVAARQVDEDGNQIHGVTDSELYMTLVRIKDALENPVNYDNAVNAMRVVLNSAQVTLPATTDLRTLTNLTQLGGDSAAEVVTKESEMAWAMTTRARFT